MLDERVRLVSLVRVPTNSGQITAVEPVVALAHAAGALVVLDACQSVGQLAVDVGALGVDALTSSGRKWLRGPRGTGFLYVRPEVLAQLEPAAADMRGGTWTAPDAYELRRDAARFELWEFDVAGRLGLKEAVDHLVALGQDAVEQAVRANAAYLRHGLGEIPGVAPHDVGADLCGLVSFTVTGCEAHQVQTDLARARVTVAVSEAASTLLDMRERGLRSVVRAAPHYFVSTDDLDRTLDVVAAIAAAAR